MTIKFKNVIFVIINMRLIFKNIKIIIIIQYIKIIKQAIKLTQVNIYYYK